jgi:hypothetical protein
VGNRVDVESSNRTKGSVISISKNGPVENEGACFYFSRPALKLNGSFLTNIGMLLGMEFTNKTKEEDWSLTITSVDSVQQQMIYHQRICNRRRWQWQQQQCIHLQFRRHHYKARALVQKKG